MADILPLAIAIPVSVTGGLTSRIIYDGVQAWRGNRKLHALLNFGSAPLYIVSPQRPEPEIPNAVLPRISCEDFFAINDFIRVLQTMGTTQPHHLRTVPAFGRPNYGDNVVTIGSTRTNPFTQRALARLGHPFEFEQDNHGEWWICRGAIRLRSEVLQQQRKAEEDNIPPDELALDDVAVIAKLRNPWRPANILLVVAGVRGIGTWGAAYYLRQKSAELYERKNGSAPYNKDGEFIAFLSIRYENFRIVGTRLEVLADIS
jgi:hypothetical protein